MNRKQYILETLERQNITEVSAMDAIHLGLDVAGMVPGIGAVADLTNAGLYAAKGQKGMAALSLAAAIPGAGLAPGATKIAKGVSKLGKTAAASKTAAKVGSAASRAATKVGVKTTKAAKTGVAAATGAKIATGAARGGAKAKIAAGLAGAKIASKMPTAFFKVAKSGRAGKAVQAAAVATKVGTKAALVAGKAAAKPTAKAAIKVGSRTIPRAAVLARGDVADTMGFDKGGKAAKDVQVGIPMGIAKGEGQAAIDKTVGGIKDALSKVPGAARNVMAKIDDYKLGSFQS